MGVREKLLIVILLSMVPWSIRADTNEVTHPDPKEFCKEAPWCSFKAIKKSWPARKKAVAIKSIEMKEGPFTVDVSADFTRLSAWNDLLAVFYKDYTLYNATSAFTRYSMRYIAA